VESQGFAIVREIVTLWFCLSSAWEAKWFSRSIGRNANPVAQVSQKLLHHRTMYADTGVIFVTAYTIQLFGYCLMCLVYSRNNSTAAWVLKKLALTWPIGLKTWLYYRLHQLRCYVHPKTVHSQLFPVALTSLSKLPALITATRASEYEKLAFFGFKIELFAGLKAKNLKRLLDDLTPIHRRRVF
jgi:hypothetical protein